MHDRDLEGLIAEWRRSLEAEELGKDEVDELEDHLREKIANVCERGIEAERAFKLAKLELGSSESIVTEFRKIDSGMWWPMRVAIPMLKVGTALVAGFLIAQVQRSEVFDPLLAAHVFVIIMGYSTALTCGAIGGVFVLQRSFMEVPLQKVEQTVRQMEGLFVIAGSLTAIGIILGAIWSDAVLHILWQGDPREIGGLWVLFWSVLFVLLARFRKVSARVVMLLGVFGNIVVSFAWLGPFAFSGSHDPFRRAQLYALVLVHVILLMIGLLPAKWIRSMRTSG
jgi:hypothetical protein